MTRRPGDPPDDTIITDTGAAFAREETFEGHWQVRIKGEQQPKRWIGTPGKHNWHDAYRYVIAKASTEGWPQGHGAKATVINWMADRFADDEIYPGYQTIVDEVNRIFKEIEKLR